MDNNKKKTVSMKLSEEIADRIIDFIHDELKVYEPTDFGMEIFDAQVYIDKTILLAAKKYRKNIFA